MDASMLERLAAALAVLAGLLYALRLAAAAAGSGRFRFAPRRRLLRPVESLALGPGVVLHVVEAGGRRLLVGAAGGGVSLLGELAAGVEEPLEAAKGIDPCCAKLASDVGRESERSRSSPIR
jgi:flagellar biogenesis protein FliO